MKTFSLFSLFGLITLTFQSLSQDITLEASRQNTMYLELAEKIDFAGWDLSEESITVSTNNGRVWKDDQIWKVQPSKRGLCILTFKDIHSDKVIAEKRLFAKNLPNPIIGYSTLAHDPTIKNRIKHIGGFYAYLEGFDFDLSIPIKEYYVKVCTQGGIERYGPFSDRRIEHELHKRIKKLDSGDIVLFYHFEVEFLSEVRSLDQKLVFEIQ